MLLSSSNSSQPVMRDAVPAIIFCLLALAMYYGPLFLGDALYFRDFQIFYTPMKHFLTESMKHGEWAFWNPRVMMGSPFFADPQSGVLYPPSLLFLLAETPKAIALSLAFHVVVAQMGVYWLARHYQIGQLAAATGAVVYGLGGWMISSGNMMAMVHSAAWAPYTLLVCERLWAAPNLRNTVIAAAIIAMQMLAGWPDMFIMIGLILVVRRLVTPGILSAKWLPYSLLAGLLATLIYSPQLLATWEAYTQSVRVGGMSNSDLFEFSAISAQWRSLVIPPSLSSENWNIFDVFPDGRVPLILSLYVGGSCIFLSLIGLSRPGRTSLSWLIIMGVGIFLAMGPANPMAVPLLKLVNMFRSPEKYLYLVHIGIALLAAFGVARLLSWIRSPRLALSTGIAIFAALSIELVVINSRIDPTVKNYYPDLRNSAETQYLSAVPGRVYSRSAAADQIDSVQELYAAYRSALSPNTGTIVGISYLNGIPFIALREQDVLHNLIDSLPPGTLLARRLGFLGTPYVMTDDPEFGSNDEWAESASRLTNNLWRLKQSAPMLSFPTRVVPLTGWEAQDAINQEDFSNGNSVFISDHSIAAKSSQEGSITRYEDKPGKVNASVATATGGLLVLRQQFYPGWRVYVDEKETSIIPTNRFFIGVEVPPGAHQVSFYFEPSHWRLGLALSALGLFALFALMMLDRRTSRLNVITSPRK